MLISFADNRTNFKGRDGIVKEVAQNRVAKIFHPGRRKAYQTEKDTLTFLNDRQYPFAPKILSANDETKTIEMEKIEGELFWNFLVTASKQQMDFIKERLHLAVKKLAENGIFHDDLTSANVIVREDKIGTPIDVVLIDFATAEKFNDCNAQQMAEKMLSIRGIKSGIDCFYKRTDT